MNPAPHGVAVNAARIAACVLSHLATSGKVRYALGTFPDVFPYLDAIAARAETMARAEEEPGFLWERTGRDWESACDEIARGIVGGAP